MKRGLLLGACLLVGGAALYPAPPGLLSLSAQAANTAPAGAAAASPAASPGKGFGDELAALEARRQQLAEKEAVLNVKEQELKKLSAALDARIREVNAAKKEMESTLQQKKKQDNERYKKMIRVYRGLKPEEAGKLMDRLDEEMVIEMLNQMDQKTAIKLIPYLNQPRVLKWTRVNLKGE